MRSRGSQEKKGKQQECAAEADLMRAGKPAKLGQIPSHKAAGSGATFWALISAHKPLLEHTNILHLAIVSVLKH